MGKSGREIWISVFAMIISCPELVKIKRGNKIKEVRSGVVGTAGGTMAVRSERYVDAQREICGAQREICGAQRSGGHGRREICGAQRDGFEGGCGVGELRLCGTPY